MKPEDATTQRNSTTTNVSASDTFETTSIPPGSHESFSIFPDTACGVPLQPQHLMIDFTPVEEVDNDFVQRKCCAFWNYLQTRKDLHNLIVLPEKNLYALDRESEPEQSSAIGQLPEEPGEVRETTAVSMLEFVEGKGLIDRTFEAKLPQSMCSLGSREYRENEAVKPSSPHKEVHKTVSVNKKCTARSTTSTAIPESSLEVQHMCSKMQDWDSKHPKSMEPPGHPPALSHCVMQRKVIL